MDGTPHVVRFDATTLWHLDAAEWAPSTASFATDPVPTNVRCASNSDCARRGSSTSTGGCSGSIGGTVARSTARARLGRADPPSDSSDWATRTGRLTTGRASWILARKRDLVLIPPEAEWQPLLHRLKSFAPVKIHHITVSSHAGGGNTDG